MNNCLVAIAGITGKLIYIAFGRYLSSKNVLSVWLSIVLISGTGLIFLKTGWMITICIGLIEMGLGAGFSIIYFINWEYFPTLILAFSFSITQFGGRASTVLSYFLAGLEDPMPSIILTLTTLFALIFLTWLIKPKADQIYTQEEHKSKSLD